MYTQLPVINISNLQRLGKKGGLNLSIRPQRPENFRFFLIQKGPEKRLPREVVVDVPSLEICKIMLDRVSEQLDLVEVPAHCRKAGLDHC